MFKTYIIIISAWLILLFFTIIFRKNRITKVLRYLAYFSLLLIILELTCLLALKIKTGYWLFNEKYNPNNIIFEPHPYLISKPKPNAELIINGVHYHNNSLGFRNKEFKKDKIKFRIIAIGGSSTYGTGVSDHQTWPYYLDSLLSENAEVLNFGISGHSTVEHIILSSFILPDYKPDIILILCGLNDLRSCYIKNSGRDYSYFHPYNLESVLGFNQSNNLPRFAVLRISIILLQKIGYYPLFNYQKVRIEDDHTLENERKMLNIYKYNLKNLISIINNTGSKIVFIPQILNQNAIKNNNLKWWIPNVRDSEIIPLIKKYNMATKEVSDSAGVYYIDNIDLQNWTKNDFVDPSHFTANANYKLACIIEKFLHENKLIR